MTLKKSSHNPCAYTFKKSFINSAVYALIYFAMFFGLTCTSIINDIIEYRRYLRIGNIDAAKDILNFKTYTVLETYDTGFFLILFEFLMISFAVVLALRLFGFLMNKSAVNVYYSLGISKNRLYLNKFFGALSALLIGTVLPFVISFFLNISFYGYSKELLFTEVYIFLKIFTCIFYSFSITCFSIVSFGSYLEAIVFGGILFFVPALVNYSLGIFFSFLVFGSPYIPEVSVTMPDLVILDQNGQQVSHLFNIVSFTKYVLPITSDELIGNIAYSYLQDINYAFYDLKWFLNPLLFLLFSIIIAVLSVVLHNNRKAEKAGFMGHNPLVQGVCVVTVTFFLTAFLIDILSDGSNSAMNNYWLYVLVGCIILSLGYFIVEFITLRSLKAVKKRLKYWFAEISIFAVTLLVIVVACEHNYSNIPKFDDIESAGITIIGEDICIKEGQSGTYSSNMYYYDEDSLRLDVSLSSSSDCKIFIDGFTEKEDIEKILSINEEIKKLKNSKVSNEFIDDNNVMSDYVYIEYTLKDGTNIKRKYLVSTFKIRQILCGLMNTENYRNLAATKLLKGERAYTDIVESNKNCSIYSADMSNCTNVALFSDRKILTELIDSLRIDIVEGTLPLNYLSDSELLGYIHFNMNEISLEYNPVTKMDESVVVTQDTKASFDNSSLYYGYLFPVYKNMTNTLKFIEKYDLDKYFIGGKDIDCITYCNYDDDCDYLRNIYNSGIMKGFKVEKNNDSDMYYDYTESNIMPDNSVVVKDKKEVQNILEKMRMAYPSCYNGLYAQVKYSDGSYCYAYIPN